MVYYKFIYNTDNYIIFYGLSNNNNFILFVTFIISFVAIFIVDGSYFRLPLYLDLSFAFK